MRLFTSDQLGLLQSPRLHVNLLATFFLDEGTYRFCDDIVDLTDGTDTYVGASALVSDIEFQSGSGISAEPVTLICDGQRMAQSGIHDPAKVLRDMMTYLHRQRRVDTAIGFRFADEERINIVLPITALKINNCQLVDQKIDITTESETSSKLIITLDSLAARYNRATFRTRSHEDQLEIDSTDNFFSFVASAAVTERTLYWGKTGPSGLATKGGIFGVGGPSWRGDAGRMVSV